MTQGESSMAIVASLSLSFRGGSQKCAAAGTRGDARSASTLGGSGGSLMCRRQLRIIRTHCARRSAAAAAAHTRMCVRRCDWCRPLLLLQQPPTQRPPTPASVARLVSVCACVLQVALGFTAEMRHSTTARLENCVAD